MVFSKRVHISSQSCIQPDDGQPSPADADAWIAPEKLGLGNFLIGIALALFLGGGALWGSLPQLRIIILTYHLSSQGSAAIGTIIEKNEEIPFEGTTDYTIRYHFRADTQVFENSVRIKGRCWYRFKPGYPVQVRYLPDNPSDNLPWGSCVETGGLFSLTFLLLIILASLIYLAGLIVTLLRGKFDSKVFLTTCKRTTMGK